MRDTSRDNTAMATVDVVVHATIAFGARFLGRPLNYTYEVVEWTPQQRFVMSTAQGPFPMETTYEWEDAPDGATLMRLRNRGEPAGFPGSQRRLCRQRSTGRPRRTCAG
jgi:hypothetical protein